VELEHLKIKTRLTNEKFPSVKGLEHLICEFQNQHELDYVTKTGTVLEQVTDRRKVPVDEKNVSLVALETTTSV
jgi:hypothetical protein